MFFNENILELRTCKLINNLIYLTLISLPVVRGEKNVCCSMWLLVTRIRNEYLFMVETGQYISIVLKFFFSLKVRFILFFVNNVISNLAYLNSKQCFLVLVLFVCFWYVKHSSRGNRLEVPSITSLPPCYLFVVGRFWITVYRKS